MGLSGIITSMVNKAETITKVDVNSDGKLAAVPFSTGTTSAGAYMVQGGGSPAPAAGGSLVKKMLVGGVVGAGVGFGASFLPIAWITNIGPGGWAAKGIMAAAGAAIGVVAGGVAHVLSRRKANLAMQAQAAATQPQGQAPTAAPNGSPTASGGTLKIGSRGPAAKKLQLELKRLGVYSGPINATYDKATSAAVRKYEVMKGVMPTGLGSPDLRAAVTQDVGLVSQYA